MPTVPLRVSPQSEQELRVLCGQPIEKLREAYVSFSGITEFIVSPKKLREELESLLPSDVARTLAKQLIALQTYALRAGKISSEILESLALGIKEKGWSEDELSKWSEVSDVMQKFMLVENVIITAKALELSYDFEHILTSINILLDIRPVYTVSKDKIAGGIISNRLRIKYQDDDGAHSISISMDKSEIEQLRKSCDDALTKISLAGEMLDKDCGVKFFATGEETDAFL